MGLRKRATRLAAMLIVADDEAAVTARLRALSATEIDDLLVTTLLVTDEAAERRRLVRPLGELAPVDKIQDDCEHCAKPSK